MHKPLLAAIALSFSNTAHAQQADAPADPTSAPAPEEPKRKRRFRIGPDVGVFFPTSSKTRDRFGGTWLSIGPGFGSVRRAGEKGRIGVDVDIMRQSKGGNRAFLIPVGASFIRALGSVSEEKSTLPFVGVSLLAIPAKLKSLPDGVDSGVKLGAGAAVFVGTTFSESAFVEARYMVTSRIEGFNFSGATLRAGYRF